MRYGIQLVAVDIAGFPAAFRFDAFPARGLKVEELSSVARIGKDAAPVFNIGTVVIVCRDVLLVLPQAFRIEAGHPAGDHIALCVIVGRLFPEKLACGGNSVDLTTGNMPALSDVHKGVDNHAVLQLGLESRQRQIVICGEAPAAERQNQYKHQDQRQKFFQFYVLL